jgi:hypothetical protein
MQQQRAARIQGCANHVAGGRRQAILAQRGRQLGRRDPFGVGVAQRLAFHHRAVGGQRDGRRTDVAAARQRIGGAALANRGQLVLHVDVGLAAPGDFHLLFGDQGIEHFAQHADRQAQLARQHRQGCLADDLDRLEHQVGDEARLEPGVAHRLGLARQDRRDVQSGRSGRRGLRSARRCRGTACRKRVYHPNPLLFSETGQNRF